MSTTIDPLLWPSQRGGARQQRPAYAPRTSHVTVRPSPGPASLAGGGAPRAQITDTRGIERPHLGSVRQARSGSRRPRRDRPVALALAAAALAVCLMVVSAMFGSSADATGSTPRDAGVPRTVVAQPGDTLWAIARRVMPKGNINPLVAQMVALNGATITVGQQVRIP